MSGVVRWLPGDGWAVIAAGMVMWMPPEAERALLEELFVLAREARFTDAANRLAVAEGSSVMLLLDPQPRLQNRGGLPVHAWDRDGAELTTDMMAGAVGVRLGSGTGPGLPVVEGVVGCGGVQWGNPLEDLQRPVPPPVVAPADERPVAVAAPPPEGFIAEVPEWVAAANPFAELWGHTMRRPVEAAAVRVVRDSDVDPESAPEQPGVDGAAPDPTGPEVPAAPPEAPAARAAQPPSPPPRRSVNPITTTLIADLSDFEDAGAEPDHGEVVGPDGRRAPILRTVVVGRAPQPLPGEECQLFRVPSPERGISRSHTAIAVVRGQVHAKDLGSNNGTILVRMGRREPLATDRWTRLASGDVLDLGEGTTVRLEGLT